MSSNIEKILYIGLAVLLLAIAFTFFFSCYNNYQDYIKKSNAILNEDKIVATSEGKEKQPGIKGTEITHQVLEVKRQERNSDLFGLYSDSIVSSHQCHTEIWVSGRNATDIEISDIENHSFYTIKFEKDYSGQIIKIQYTLR